MIDRRLCRLLVPAFGLALTACGTLEDTGHRFEVGGITHQVYAVRDGSGKPGDYRVFYRDFTIMCPSLASCQDKVRTQQHHIDLIYRAEPD